MVARRFGRSKKPARLYCGRQSRRGASGRGPNPQDRGLSWGNDDRQTGPIGGTYEKLVARLPYIIAYAVTKEAGREVVSILRVIHTSRDWSDEKWPA